MAYVAFVLGRGGSVRRRGLTVAWRSNSLYGAFATVDYVTMNFITVSHTWRSLLLSVSCARPTQVHVVVLHLPTVRSHSHRVPQSLVVFCSSYDLQILVISRYHSTNSRSMHRLESSSSYQQSNKRSCFRVHDTTKLGRCQIPLTLTAGTSTCCICSGVDSKVTI